MNKILNALKANSRLLFTKSKKLKSKELKKKKRIRNRLIGFTLILAQILIMLIFLFLIFRLNLIPEKYLIMAIVVLVLITAYNFTSQYTKAHIFGKVLSVLLSITMLTGSFYVAKTSSVLEIISGGNTEKHTCSIIILNSDPASSLDDIKNYPFGYSNSVDKNINESVISKLSDQFNSKIDSTAYSSWELLAGSLDKQTVKAIVVSDSCLPLLEAAVPTFKESTRVLSTIEIETKISQTADKNVTKEPFTIYVAGNDSFENLQGNGKNDVNIIATFNPNTRQILLVSTPRDYYTNIYKGDSNLGLDKLTHAGNLGITSSIKTLENLYGANIDYFVRINFPSTIDIVNSFGGITINSEIDFYTSYDTNPFRTFHYVVGENECDGEKTLAFCREREVFTNGDNQRGRNQMLAIQGIIKKAASPAIITNYVSVLNGVSHLFWTNMSNDDISSIVKTTLSDSKGWNIQMYNVTGFGLPLNDPGRPSHLYPSDPNLKHMSVVLPDYNSINTAIKLMSMVKNGEVFDVNTYVNSTQTTEAQ